MNHVYKAYFGLTGRPRQEIDLTYNAITVWLKEGKGKRLPLRIHRTWWELTDHTGCYFFFINTNATWIKNKHKILYPGISSANPPTLQSDELPMPILIVSLYLKMYVATKSKQLLIKVKKYSQNTAILLMRLQTLNSSTV